MKKVYFVIFDKVAKTYGDLFTAQNFEVLRRDMEGLIEENKLPHWPDKSVKQLFIFDVQSAEIVEDVKEWHLIDIFSDKYQKLKKEAETLKNEAKKFYPNREN